MPKLGKKRFMWSVMRTTLVGLGLLLMLVKIGNAFAFSEDAYFAGALVVVVIAALSDRADSYNVARRRARSSVRP